MDGKANIARLWEQDLAPDVRERFDAVRLALASEEEEEHARRVQEMRERHLSGRSKRDVNEK